MDWNASTLWWLIAGTLVAAELTSGSFYLLMLALGCAAGALAAHVGWGLTAQLVAAALSGGGATAVWHLRRARSPRSAPVPTNRDVQIDIGERVQVPHWAADGTARVMYRGASWAARFAGGGAPAPGEHVIVAMRGNELSLAPQAD